MTGQIAPEGAGLPGDQDARPGPEHFGEPGDRRVWVRIANIVLDRIERGEYSGRMPSRYGIAAEFGTGAVTGQRVLRELGARGVIYRAGTMGYYVQGDGHDGAPGDPRASVRITGTLLGRIASGDLKPGDAVPPVEALSREHQCSRRTVTKALTALEARRVLRYHHGKGYQVLPPGDDSAAAGETGDLRTWVRVAAAILDRIGSGELRAGGLVPAKHVLARDLGVSASTVQRAIAELARQGVIRLGPGNRYRVCASFSYVPAQEPARRAPAGEQLVQALQWMWDGAYKIGETEDGKLEAWRVDGSGTLYADTPEELRDLIRADYGLRPVAAL